jgi:hypothetical protein
MNKRRSIEKNTSMKKSSNNPIFLQTKPTRKYQLRIISNPPPIHSLLHLMKRKLLYQIIHPMKHQKKSIKTKSRLFEFDKYDSIEYNCVYEVLICNGALWIIS